MLSLTCMFSVYKDSKVRLSNYRFEKHVWKTFLNRHVNIRMEKPEVCRYFVVQSNLSTVKLGYNELGYNQGCARDFLG